MRLVPDDVLGALTIRGEADGEPFQGKVAVGITIRNRMRHRYQSDGTVAGTVLKPNQFSMWRYPWPWLMTSDDENERVQEAQLAWEESEGSDLLPPDAVLYHAEYVLPGWAQKVQFIRKIGRHLFYADPIITKG